MVWVLANSRRIELSRPRIMAIVNVTPDSFADGGKLGSVDDAFAAVCAARDAGADIIDIGGESTRPGSLPVTEAEQIRRVVPLLEACRRAGGCDLPISVDTTRAAVAAAALEAGADAVNDVSGGDDDPGMIPLVAAKHCGYVVMHRRVEPTKDVFSDRYASAPDFGGDVVGSVHAWLLSRRRAIIDAGADPAAIVLDPGLGFGKSVEQNLELIRATGRLVETAPVLSALSRKSFVGRVSLGRDSVPAERLAGTIALSVAHLHAGARIFRVHDVREHVEALAAAWAVLGTGGR